MRKTTAAGWVPVVVLLMLLSGCGMRVQQAATNSGQQPNTAITNQAPQGGSAGEPAPAQSGAAQSRSAASTPGGGPAASSAGAGSNPSPAGSTAGGSASAKAATRGPAAATAERSKAAQGASTGSANANGTSAGGGSSAGPSGAKSGSSSGGQALPGSVNAPGPDSQGISSDRVRVGVVAPISGAAGFLGQSAVDGITAYTSMRNAQGGVNGRKYQLVIGDSQFDQAVEAAVTKRMVEREKVFILLSVAGDSIAPYVTSVGIPAIVIGVTPPTYSSKYPTVYPLVQQVVDFVAAMAYQLRDVLKLPIKTTAILYGNQNFAWAKWAKYAKKAWEYFGVEVKSMDQFDISNGDCTSIVLKMKNLNIDFWQVAQSVGWPLCQQAMARQHYTPPLGRGGPFTGTYNYVSQAGLAMDGVYSQTYGVEVRRDTCDPYFYEPGVTKAPECQNYLNSMKQYATDASIDSLEDVWAQLYWTGGKLVDDAMRHQSGALTWAGINQWIGHQTAWLSGLAAPINFTPTCKTGGRYWMYQWKVENGHLVHAPWRDYGGEIKIPVALKNHVFPGAGDCYVTAMADAEL
jgi:ABC-type branched-subunit amino acid transport system substrate-binding protein